MWNVGVFVAAKLRISQVGEGLWWVVEGVLQVVEKLLQNVEKFFLEIVENFLQIVEKFFKTVEIFCRLSKSFWRLAKSFREKSSCVSIGNENRRVSCSREEVNSVPHEAVRLTVSNAARYRPTKNSN